MNSKNESNNRQEKESRSAIIRPYKIVSYISVALFAGLIVYMICFQLFKSEELLNSPLNKRQAEVEEQIIRGPILSSDEQVLAQTVSDPGTEDGRYRVYPFYSLFAHTVGYDMYGGSGLESSHNNDLLQSHSSIVSQVKNELKDEKKQGDSLVTTMRVPLQQAASDALSGMKGSVVVMDTDTGKILANVSSPSFDPNTIEQDWDILTQDESGVFLNRSMQGLYPPGSTFKIVTALAYLRTYGSFDAFSYECTGSYECGGFTIHCANGNVHGYETMADAMANSCNCAFAAMAVEQLDYDFLRKTAESLGFNTEMKAELPFMESLFDLDKNTADQLAMQTAIGQGDTMATPMLMCMIADAVANGGNMMMPLFTEEIRSADGRSVSKPSGSSFGQVMTTEEAEQIKELLYGVVRYGTAYELSDLPYSIAGKTGTAEYGDVAYGQSHSWFVGFSNTGNNDIVVSVLVEDGGNGTLYGTTVARQIFQAWFGV
ncbi:MAG: penicillin-binding protein 2 [Eubacterium sp.]|nr:penicillin-binding protein 2 [Eubacterium sp.]